MRFKIRLTRLCLILIHRIFKVLNTYYKSDTLESDELRICSCRQLTAFLAISITQTQRSRCCRSHNRPNPLSLDFSLTANEHCKVSNMNVWENMFLSNVLLCPVSDNWARLATDFQNQRPRARNALFRYCGHRTPLLNTNCDVDKSIQTLHTQVDATKW